MTRDMLNETSARSEGEDADEEAVRDEKKTREIIQKLNEIIFA